MKYIMMWINSQVFDGISAEDVERARAAADQDAEGDEVFRNSMAMLDMAEEPETQSLMAAITGDHTSHTGFTSLGPSSQTSSKVTPAELPQPPRICTCRLYLIQDHGIACTPSFLSLNSTCHFRVRFYSFGSFDRDLRTSRSHCGSPTPPIDLSRLLILWDLPHGSFPSWTMM